VHVAVAGVHVQRDEHAPAQHSLWIASMRSSTGPKTHAVEDLSSAACSSLFHEMRTE
jgi:hypothetical protein